MTSTYDELLSAFGDQRAPYAGIGGGRAVNVAKQFYPQNAGSFGNTATIQVLNGGGEYLTGVHLVFSVSAIVASAGQLAVVEDATNTIRTYTASIGPQQIVYLDGASLSHINQVLATSDQIMGIEATTGLNLDFVARLARAAATQTFIIRLRGPWDDAPMPLGIMEAPLIFEISMKLLSESLVGAGTYSSGGAISNMYLYTAWSNSVGGAVSAAGAFGNRVAGSGSVIQLYRDYYLNTAPLLSGATTATVQIQQLRGLCHWFLVWVLLNSSATAYNNTPTTYTAMSTIQFQTNGQPWPDQAYPVSYLQNVQGPLALSNIVYKNLYPVILDQPDSTADSPYENFLMDTSGGRFFGGPNSTASTCTLVPATALAAASQAYILCMQVNGLKYTPGANGSVVAQKLVV